MEEGNRQAPDCTLPHLPPAILNLSSDDPDCAQAPKPPALFTCSKVVFGFILELLLMILWLQPGTEVSPRNVALACARGTIYTGASSIGYSLVLTLKAQGKPEEQTWVTTSVSEALGLSDNACSPLTIRSKRDTLDFLFQPTALPSLTPAPSSSSASPSLAPSAVAEAKVMATAATSLPSLTSEPSSSSESPSLTTAVPDSEKTDKPGPDKAGSKLGYNSTESPSFSKQDWCLDADQYCAPVRNQKGFTIPLSPVLVGASSVALVMLLIFASFLAGIFFKRFAQSESPSDPTLYALRTTKEELNKRNQ